MNGWSTFQTDSRWRPNTSCKWPVSSRIATCFLWTACGAVQAGPPFQTDDPEPVSTKHYEINLAVQQTRTASGRSGTSPLAEINYGAAADVQLHAALPISSNAGPGFSQRGLGDIEVGIKYRLLQETGTTPMVAIYPTVLFPTGNSDRGLGNGREQIFLPVWVQKSQGPWTADAGAGYWINHAAAARDNWFAGVLLQRAISERVSLGAELFYRSEQSLGVGASSGFNVGGTWNFSEHSHVLFSIGRGIQNSDATNRLSTYVAYQVTR